MQNITSEKTDVKLHKTRNALERESVTELLAKALGFRKEADAGPREINRARFRAVCADCSWSYDAEGDEDPQRSARTKAHAHWSVKDHTTRSVFDIIGQEDVSYFARMSRSDDA